MTALYKFIHYYLFLLGSPCESDDIKDLTEWDRSATSLQEAKDRCDHEDLDRQWHFWYKVSGKAGNALAADVPAAGYTCGTNVRLYLRDNHPSPSDGKVTLRVCAATTNNVCEKTLQIKVINCGAFYLYELKRYRPKCSPTTWRYCTNGGIGEYYEVFDVYFLIA